MPTIEENRDVWNGQEAWELGDKEWSSTWGGAEAQWWSSINTRIHSFIPTGTILELGPGEGRWTSYLHQYCEHLIIVDLAENCIEKCKSRFKNTGNISYYSNDGKSLDFIQDNSVDFVFSFDSLVHADPEVMDNYLKQLSHLLKKDGVGFIHHSNLGDRSTYISRREYIMERVNKLVPMFNLQKPLNTHRRDPYMTAALFEIYCNKYNLSCISQEIIPWGETTHLDCISLFTSDESKWARPNLKYVNDRFMKEAHYIAKLSRLYCRSALLDK